jgi:hypothetical protein
MASAVATHKGATINLSPAQGHRIFAGHRPIVSVLLTIRVVSLAPSNHLEVLVNGSAVSDGTVSSLSRTWALWASHGAIQTIDINLIGSGSGATFDYELSVYI